MYARILFLISVGLLIVSCTVPVSQPIPDQPIEAHDTSDLLQPTATSVVLPSSEEPEDPSFSEDDYSITVMWESEYDYAPTNALLVATDIDVDFIRDEDRPVYDLLTWDGDRFELFEIHLHENLDLQTPSILEAPIRSPWHFGFALGDSVYAQELYWIDFLKRRITGIKPVCSSLLTAGEDSIAVGSKWGTYVCDEDQVTWHFFRLSNPGDEYMFELQIDQDIAEDFEPYWISENTLALDRGVRHRCIVNVTDPEAPELACAEFDLVLGEFSPDRKYIEAREPFLSNPSRPQRLGYIEVNCIIEPADCDPVLYTAPLDASKTQVDLDEATWIPDGSGILYKWFRDDLTDSSPELETLLWTLNLKDESFKEIADIKEPLNLLSFYQHAYAIWSPEGDRVILQNTKRIYAYNVEDGTLELLSDEGGLAIGAIQLP